MSLRVVLRPEAQADLLETGDWYEQQETLIGDGFRRFSRRGCREN
jgi:hypothetical protein